MVQIFSLFFFFKQKTAYGVRISDWSSDVCSSDLLVADVAGLAHADHGHPTLAGQNHLAGTYEISVDMGQQTLYGFELEANGTLCRLNQVAGLVHVRDHMGR